MKIIKPQVFSSGSFNRSSTATYYASTGLLATAAAGVLRIGYDPVTLELEGPVLEAAATNKIIFSNTFTSWSPIGTVSVTPGAAISPTGVMDATLFSSAVFDSIGIPTPTLAVNGTFSIYVKHPTLLPYPSGKKIILSKPSGEVVFDFYSDHAPTVTTSGPEAYSIQQLSNGWYRIATQGTGNVAQVRVATYGNQVYLFGAQLEDGMNGVPSSYIPTTGVIRTRSADSLLGIPPMLIFSTVTENDAPVWSFGSPYSVGDQVIIGASSAVHRVYEAIIDSPTSFPPDDPTEWLDTGPTNAWRMLDMATGVERQTVANAPDGNITTSLAVVGPVSSVVLLNVEGGEVEIEVRDEQGSLIGEFYTTTLGLPRDTGWWDFFFGQRPDSSMFIFSDFNLPTGAPGTIQVTVKGGGDPAKIGKLIIGEEVYIGCTKFGSSGGIIDFSRKQRDDFGNTTILERRYIDKFDYDIQIETADAYSIKNFLASIRAIPAVYIGSENHLITVVFGFYRDFSIILQGPVKSACSLQTEGL